MKTFAGLTCLLGLLVAVAVTNAAEEKPKQPEGMIAKKINSVEYEFTKGDKPQLVVTASTTVPTGGYKANLVRVTYIKQPDDGIQDYNLYLTKPDGFVTQVISEVKASDSWPAESTAWVKGVRVHGEGDGVVVKMIEQKK
jgi:hypothetical protein